MFPLAPDDEDAVIWAVDKGITTGTGATTFNPNGSRTLAPRPSPSCGVPPLEPRSHSPQSCPLPDW